MNLIKVCGDPQCEAVWHNIPKEHTTCNDCGGRVMLINEITYKKKYINNFFQYDFLTGDLLHNIDEKKKIK